MLNEFIETFRALFTTLDILFIAFILYRVYVLLSRTRAMQLLVGFAMILVVDIVARQFQLETLSWLITNVSSYLVFGLIVLMQPELRRMIVEIGQMPIFRWFTTNTRIPTDEIVDAVKHMAETQTGSIIVLLRKIRPQGIIESAVQLDSQITSELLETLFFKDTPLHDGAVMIEGNRIVAASCYLPLSNSPRLKKSYGARHRAAMGFSEDSDAVILVTSEESGSISILVNGEFYTPVHPTELRGLLRRILSGGELPEMLRVEREADES